MSLPNPERALFAAVINMAIRDCVKSRGLLRDEAYDFIFSNERWFYQVCDLADVNPEWIKDGLRRTFRKKVKLHLAKR